MSSMPSMPYLNTIKEEIASFKPPLSPFPSSLHSQHHHHQEGKKQKESFVTLTPRERELFVISMSNMSGDGGSLSSGNTGEAEVQQQQQQQQHILINGTSASTNTNSNSSASQQPPATPPPPVKKKRNLPGTPDPTAEVIALSPTTLMATNRFVCEICNKGFQRDQNLQLHRRGHNLPWKLRQRTSTEIRKRVYICPEVTCVHHNPSRALGDLTGIKKHFCRKHGEKKWKCDKCSKKYAVQSDWKAHSKTCGTREYKCDCGTIFSRRDSFITHRAFCDALTEENNNKGGHGSSVVASMPEKNHSMAAAAAAMPDFFPELKNPLKPLQRDLMAMPLKPLSMASAAMFSSNSGALFGSVHSAVPSASASASLQLGGSHASAHMSATALLQKAAQMGATASGSINSPMLQRGMVAGMAGHDMRALGGFEQTPEQFFNPAGDLAGFAGVFESGGGVKMVQREWEMMTVDFMGVDRGRSVHEHHQQQQRLQGLHPFQHPLIMRHGQQAMEKSMEDV